MGAWLLRNRGSDGTWMGARIDESVPFFTAVSEAVLSFDALLFPGQARWLMAISGPLCSLFIALSVVVVLCLAFKRDERTRRALLLNAVLIASYMLALLYSRMTTHIDPLFAFGWRYMIPMLPFFLIVVTLILAYGEIPLDSAPKRIAAWTFFGACLVTEALVAGRLA
jgi:hypothetical protein